MDDRLYRSRDERMIAGVAGGLAERMDLDPSLVRIIWAVLVLPTGFLALLVYVIMAIVVPQEPPDPGLTPTAPTPTGDATGTGAQASEIATATVPLDWRAQRRAERRARRAARGSSGNGAIVFGAILVVVGALFLVRQFLPQLDFDLLWPVSAIILGVALVIGSVRRA